MVGLIEIFLFDFYFHHHLNRRSDILFVVITFQSLLKTEEGLQNFVLFVVD